MGYVTLGLFSGTIQGIEGAILLMLSLMVSYLVVFFFVLVWYMIDIKLVLLNIMEV